MKLLFSPKGIVLTAALLALLVSVFNWFVLEEELQAIYIGLWVPSILAAGAVVLAPPWRGGPRK